ncbi:MAG: heparinase II/III family protein [Candidatus Obscuribacterales bacterium]|nr:heparinase II/III family protein [Candidatus Obscuribacterales bacterium]
MNVGRLLRTVRYLSVNQISQRIVKRGRRMLAARFVKVWEPRLRAYALQLPEPDYALEAVHRISHHVRLLQQPHEKHLHDFRNFRFHFLNREVVFAEGKVDWNVDLAEGTNPLWKLNLYYVGYLVPMLVGGNAEDLQFAGALIEDMETANPFSNPAVFRDCWNPYAVSHRIVNLISAASLFRAAGGSLAGAAAKTLSDHIRLCVAVLLDNLEYELQFNHLLKNFTALSVYAASVGGVTPAFDWLEAELVKSLEQNILADGCHSELSPMYHALALLDLRILRDAKIWSPSCAALIESTISSMERALSILSHPDGDVALFNDAWLGEAPPASALVPASALPGLHALTDAGYIRLEGTREALIFDCGACGPDLNPGHAHADFLSVEASVDGKRLLVDYGTPTYSAGALRDLCRSASSHNGPALAKAEPIEFWLSFRVGRRGYARPLRTVGLDGFMPLWCAGVQNGYSHLGVTVKRYLGMVPGRCFAIVDVWQGTARDDEVTYLRIPENWLVSRLESANELRLIDGPSKVRLVCSSGTIDSVQNDCWYPEFNLSAPVCLITVRPTISGDLRYLALLFLYDQGELEQMSFESLARALARNE